MTETQNKTILVFGATGQQGGSVARHLLAGGWKVRAFTRDAAGAAAKELALQGAELYEGDMADRAALEQAMQDIYGVFSVQPPVWDLTAVDGEVELGSNVANAARRMGVQHFIYASASGAETQAHFRPLAKWEIEKYIRAIGLPATILRLTFFMENYVSPYSAIREGVYSEAIAPDVPVHLIAVDDIGAFAKLALDHPQRYIGRTLELAGDALTPPEIAAAVSRATGQSIEYARIPMEVLREQSEIAASIYEWLNARGHVADLPALREWYPGLTSFEAWLSKKGAAEFAAMSGR
ncbi:NmrA/HSCARG family protein [Paenibacillus thalictri]|uniref:NmrA/HSCARG family protein n=1 Tax=Paenibacillus thalictri TaxID=2527873 RepID=A0A4Q9DV15_9BACL|nr:NmrA/HSCARG family protein [Paenibacillus thalictri]TBL78630.1 NmrA/HSCARG family protein [Paenibacillus thalictri]